MKKFITVILLVLFITTTGITYQAQAATSSKRSASWLRQLNKNISVWAKDYKNFLVIRKQKRTSYWTKLKQALLVFKERLSLSYEIKSIGQNINAYIKQKSGVNLGSSSQFVVPSF